MAPDAPESEIDDRDVDDLVADIMVTAQRMLTIKSALLADAVTLLAEDTVTKLLVMSHVQGNKHRKVVREAKKPTTTTAVQKVSYIMSLLPH